MSVNKVEYRDYKIKRSGMVGIWLLERPDNTKRYIKETEDQKFETEQDFQEYIDLIEDLKDIDIV